MNDIHTGHQLLSTLPLPAQPSQPQLHSPSRAGEQGWGWGGAGSREKHGKEEETIKGWKRNIKKKKSSNGNEEFGKNWSS